MKKLMIAGVIAVAAVAANAAVALKWTAEGLEYKGGLVGSETSMYILNLGGDTAQYDTSGAYAAIDAIVQSWQAGSDKSGEALSKMVWESYQGSYSTWKSEEFVVGDAAIQEAVDKSKYYSGIILYTHTGEDGTIDAVMANVATTSKIGSGGGVVGDIATDVGGSWGIDFDLPEGSLSTQWYSLSSPTPEPTSGLLLLLGVAGLALRRRRA